jgi:hypothetical protein
MRVRPDIGFQRGSGGDLTRRDGDDDGLLVIDPHAHVRCFLLHTWRRINVTTNPEPKLLAGEDKVAKGLACGADRELSGQY